MGSSRGHDLVENCETLATSQQRLTAQDPAVENESKCPVTGKRKYATEGEALATSAHQIATANAPKDLRAYRCSWCDAWHITKTQPNPKRVRRARRI